MTWEIRVSVLLYQTVYKAIIKEPETSLPLNLKEAIMMFYETQFSSVVINVPGSAGALLTVRCLTDSHQN